MIYIGSTIIGEKLSKVNFAEVLFAVIAILTLMKY